MDRDEVLDALAAIDELTRRIRHRVAEGGPLYRRGERDLSSLAGSIEALAGDVVRSLLEAELEEHAGGMAH